MEGKHIKNDNFHPIIQFRKGQTLLANSDSMARLSIIGILQYSCQHSEIICLPTGITVTVLELFLKQGRKLTNDRSTHRIYGLLHSTDVDPAEVTTAFRLIGRCILCLCKNKREKFSGKELHKHLNTIGADLDLLLSLVLINVNSLTKINGSTQANRASNALDFLSLEVHRCINVDHYTHMESPDFPQKTFI